jgi:hypothetical protein
LGLLYSQLDKCHLIWRKQRWEMGKHPKKDLLIWQHAKKFPHLALLLQTKAKN